MLEVFQFIFTSLSISFMVSKRVKYVSQNVESHIQSESTNVASCCWLTTIKSLHLKISHAVWKFPEVMHHKIGLFLFYGFPLENANNFTSERERKCFLQSSIIFGVLFYLNFSRVFDPLL